MLAPRMRPTFSLPTPLGPRQVIARLRSAVAESADEYHGRFTDRHAMISIAQSKRHFWSPWLHIEVRGCDDTKSIWGRFSPNPSIWTGFMFSYLGLAVTCFFACIVGVSQWLAGEHPWGFWGCPTCGLVAVGLWAASQAGQKLAWAEMASMKDWVEASVGYRPEDENSSLG